MANQGSTRQDRPADQSVPTRRSRQSEMNRWDPGSNGPFAWMRQMQDQLDHAFSSLWNGSGPGASWLPDTSLGRADWTPAIDVFHRGNDLVVRADVPGLTKDDITVDIADDKLSIRGERRHDHEEECDGMIRTERSYGSFCREVPLPQGAITDSAKATFNNGVLEIVMQAPSADVRRGRRVEIKERAPERKPDQQKP